MKKDLEVLALIPARGNSKSIPRKNIRDFAGYPLIVWSIAAAKQSRLITRIVVSTDDEKIAGVSLQHGVEIPFIRPAELAQDTTPDLPVFQHALNWLKDQEDYLPNMVVQLRPTSPIRPPNLIDQAIVLLADNLNVDSVRGVVASDQNPYKMWRINQEGTMIPLLTIEGIPEAYNVPRQDLPLTYWQTGHIDVIRTSTILKKKSMSGDVILPLIIDSAYTVDIDNQMDWQRAERCVQEKVLDIVTPHPKMKEFPASVRLLVLDFDGVFTDDRVWVNGKGKEIVAASRGDGLGLELLRKDTDIQVMVISKEKDPVVAARCNKLNIPFTQAVDEKDITLREIMKEKGLQQEEVIFVGNDLNDLVCFPLVGFTMAPINAVSEVKQRADLVLESRGGFGAVREICEMLIKKFPKKPVEN